MVARRHPRNLRRLRPTLDLSDDWPEWEGAGPLASIEADTNTLKGEGTEP